MFRFFFFFVFLPIFSAAQILKPQPGTYINDYTNNLSKSQVQALNERLLQFEQQTTIQVAVLLINDLPENTNIEEYARAIGNTWKVGINHNGLVYVAVLNERRQRLEVAKNLESDITDLTAFEIIENLKPYLQQKDYYGALEELITQISNRVGGSANPSIGSSYMDAPSQTFTGEQPATKEVTEYEKQKAKWDHYGTYALWLLLTGAAGFSVWAWRYKRKYVKEHTVNGVYIGIGSAYFTSTYGSGSSDSGGGGSSGFGGFGGGGGGGFSGGGASGSW